MTNTYDLYKFEPLPQQWLDNLGTDDYDRAVGLIEYHGYQIVERCLAHCCEIIGNNTDTYEEAIEMLTRDTDRYFPLSEYGLDTQIEIYNQWLESLDK